MEAVVDRAERVAHVTAGEAAIEHLGGAMFALLTGAHGFACGKNFVQFDLPDGVAKEGINKVRVESRDGDTFAMTFWSCDYTRHTVNHTVRADGLRGDALRGVFGQRTGLTVQG